MIVIVDGRLYVVKVEEYQQQALHAHTDVDWDRVRDWVRTHPPLGVECVDLDDISP
jgi:hypothetical protein